MHEGRVDYPYLASPLNVAVAFAWKAYKHGQEPTGTHSPSGISKMPADGYVPQYAIGELKSVAASI